MVISPLPHIHNHSIISSLSSKYLLPLICLSTFTLNILEPGSAWFLQKPPAIFLSASSLCCTLLPDSSHHLPVLHLHRIPWTPSNQVHTQPCPLSCLHLPRPSCRPVAFQPLPHSLVPLFSKRIAHCTQLLPNTMPLSSPPHLRPPEYPSPLSSRLSVKACRTLFAKPAGFIICTVHGAVIMHCLLTLLFSLKQEVKRTSAIQSLPSLCLITPNSINHLKVKTNR